MKGTYGISYRLRMHVVGSRSINKTEIGQRKSGTVSEIMTYMALTMTILLDPTAEREPETREGSSCSRATLGR
jgi:hypothetical protein